MTVVKRMNYRGNPNDDWSNTDWFPGVAPTTDTQWKSMADALIAAEKTVYLGLSAVVRVYGYNSNDDNAASVYTYDYAAASATVAGTMTTGTGTYPAGDQAAWIRWKTSRRTIHGKAIYLRKYFHSVPTTESSAGAPDGIATTWPTAANAFATTLQSGSGIGFGPLTDRKHVDVLTAHAISPFITVRTLKRRGKRPKAA